ncbi:hypothetical protein [Roseateles depolymerans]|uniref:Uncharacterized protein n=1 Tax=Roseateles depolymerans TaxID=76731 RepID=A0A0U3LND2_9BURK|nr:hypothetical protein [Roseateles depolymerans]ALV07954.1 hypothetical protein RD2015_3497 [Roseateles depolymerans]REG21827.1 hypothetical protein DES44_0955 [Roseateles depolymerans]
MTLSLLVPATAVAGPPRPVGHGGAQGSAAACSAGVWLGTLGGTPISLELRSPEDRAQVGRYYYRASLGDLFLKQDASTGEWQEEDENGKSTGLLRLSCQSETLSGEWRSMDGARRLPVLAKAAPEAQYPVARAGAIKPTGQKSSNFQKRRFDLLTFGPQGGGTEGVRLVGTAAGLDAINAALRQAAVEAVSDHLECKASGRLERGPDAGYEAEIRQQVEAWNDRYVVIRTYTEGYCGGAHPWHDTFTTTFQLDTGAKVDVSTWLLPEYRKDIGDASPLGRLLRKTYEKGDLGPEYSECKDSIAWNGASLHGLPGQLVFHTSAPYALTPCAEDVALPLAQVQRFLSPEGRQAMMAFR